MSSQAGMQKAIIVLEDGHTAGIRDVPIPKPRDEWVLVKPTAVALNPTDWKHIDFIAADAGSRCGCDFAGTVLEVGSKVTKFKKGDRISGMVHGG
jgi:NADPH:quinone reductase-like Zn-dependent oxidoreductase